MAKERLSKLQRWILTKCYEDGKYGGRYDHHTDGGKSSPRVDYYLYRRDLIAKRISEYYKEYGEPDFIKERVKMWGKMIDIHDREKEKLERNRVRNKLEVSTHNSIKTLRDKGYIVTPPNELHYDEIWRWQGIWLTKEGIELVEGLIINNLI